MKDKQTGRFLYERIEAQLLQMIREMPQGERLPPRSVLTERFQVTRTTIDRAIAQLIARGELTALRGSGTYAARGLENSSQYVGLVLPDLTTSGYPEIIRGAEEEAGRHHLSIAVCTTDLREDKQAQHVLNFIQKRVRGLIIVPNVRLDPVSFWMKELADSGIPYVFCNRSFGESDAPAVLLNNFYAAYCLTKHLIGQGRRRIAFLSYPMYSSMRERYQGYLSCLMENGVDYSEKLTYFEETFDPENTGSRGLAYLLDGPEKPDAIVCGDDQLAFNAIKALQERGLRVPADIAVAGFDNSFVCHNPYCNITSVDFRSFSMGENACRMLLEQHEQSYRLLKQIYVTHPDVVVRESSGGVRSAPEREGGR